MPWRRRPRRADLAAKYGLDYEEKMVAWVAAMEADPDVTVGSRQLLIELIKRGVVERIESPAPYGVVAWRITSLR